MTCIRALFAMAAIHSSLALSSELALSVELDGGKAMGFESNGVGCFLGLPFAEPPVGDKRWRPPQRKDPWGPRVWDATKFGHNCLQDPSGSFMGWPQPLETLSEDCLYLNVYAPRSRPASPVPVMLWIYGGAFAGGGGNETRLNGTWDVRLMEGELIVVTFNYRLGAFGFLAADELRNRDPAGGTGNYGILDQRMAMQWVQENIAAFGGDPKRVFLVGQSAGANSVSQHLVRPQSWGLFSSAGLESGAFYDEKHPRTVSSVRDSYYKLLVHAGCTQTDGIDCLLTKPASVLLNASLRYSIAWGPVVDGVDSTHSGVRLAMEGKLAPVPVLVGSVSEDASSAKDASCQPESCTETDFRQWAKTAFIEEVGKEFSDPEIDRLVELYGQDPVPLGSYTRWYWAAKHAGADQWGGCYARRTASWVVKAGQLAFYYRWTYAPKGPNGAYPSLAHHAVEQPFVFHVLEETAKELAEDRGMYHIEASDIPLSTSIVRYWASMAATGRPLGDVEWPAFNKSHRAGLVIESSPRAEINLRGAQCDFWDEYDALSRSIEVVTVSV
eukprot:TRINITY_DN43098_c0_g1_i1.p1 TRINITY_DN43098_c0_g1~~TRINITY_DN43098_c0_g1_i1.p1  ORF type:complete len:555 (+),score=65.12 TRINITY_DN43098_c0_g1_i1:63-1727(+)